MIKKILEAIKELVTEANFDCTNSGIALQAMDTSHVSLVGLFLRADGWEHFRCDRCVAWRRRTPSPLTPRAPERSRSASISAR